MHAEWFQFAKCKVVGRRFEWEKMEDEAMTRFTPQRSIACLEQKRKMAADFGSNLLGALGANSAVQVAAGAGGQNVAATAHLTAELSGTGQGSLTLVSGS